MLDKKSKILLQRLVDGDTLDILAAVGNSLVARMNGGTVQHETAYLTAVEAVKREERVLIINRFLKEIEEAANNMTYGEG